MFEGGGFWTYCDRGAIAVFVFVNPQGLWVFVLLLEGKPAGVFLLFLVNVKRIQSDGKQGVVEFPE